MCCCSSHFLLNLKVVSRSPLRGFTLTLKLSHETLWETPSSPRSRLLVHLAFPGFGSRTPSHLLLSKMTPSMWPRHSAGAIWPAVMDPRVSTLWINTHPGTSVHTSLLMNRWLSIKYRLLTGNCFALLVQCSFLCATDVFICGNAWDLCISISGLLSHLITRSSETGSETSCVKS